MPDTPDLMAALRESLDAARADRRAAPSTPAVDPETALQAVAVHWSALILDPQDRPRVAFDGHELRCVETLQIAVESELPEITARRPRVDRAFREYATVTMKMPVASQAWDTRRSVLSLFTGPDPQRVLDSLEQLLELTFGYGNGNSAVLEAQAEARRLLAQAGRS